MLSRSISMPIAPIGWIAAGCLWFAMAAPACGEEYDSGLDPLPYRLPTEVDPALQTGFVEPSATDDRLAALEAEVKRLSAVDGKRKTDAAKKPTFQIGGQLQTDYLYFGQDADSRAAFGAINDGVYFRRARFVAQGEAFEQIKYAIGFDFSLPGRPSFLDVFVGMHDLPILGNARVGHYFEPFSLERLTQNRYNTFMERSLADIFAPARNTGFNAYDTYGAADRGTWSVGWFASNSDNYGDQFMDAGGQAVTGRLTWLPFYDEASDGRSYVHIGGGYSYRTPPDGNLSYAPFPEARPGTPTSATVQPFVNTGLISAEHNQLFGAEFAWIAGPLSFQAEYMYVPVEQIGGPELAFQGAYAYVSYFLTGEHRPYNKQLGFHDRVIPFEDFFRVRTCDGPVVHGRGAWELAARWSFIDLTDENIVGGVEHNGTLGLNWYLNPYTRVKWEYIVAQVDRPPAGDSTTHIAGMRFDIDF
jgi:phosphate-selective porin OprO and OprP